MPFVARWPGKIEPGTKSDALFGQVDLATSFSAMVGAEIPTGGLPDSRDELDTLLGQDQVGRDHLIHEANGLALRSGPWKYVSPGRVRDKLGPWTREKLPPPGRLYNVANDPQEQTDLADREQEQLAQLRALLKKIENEPDGGTHH